MYVLPGHFSFKMRLRRALREMLVCAAILMLFFVAISKGVPSWEYGMAIVLCGLVFCPIPWGVYRLGRLVLTR